MKRSVALFLAVTLLILFSLTGNLLATNFYSNKPPDDRSQFGFSFLKPNPGSSDHLSFLTGIFLFEGQFAISDKGSLGLTFPLSMATFSSSVSADDEMGAGNLLVQYKQRIRKSETSSSWWTAEFYIPTSDAENSSLEIGLFTDFSHFPSCYPETATAGFQFANRKLMGPNRSAFQQLEAGFWVMFSSDYADETELIFHYGYSFGITNQEYTAGIEILGQYFMTDMPYGKGDSEFLDLTYNQVVLGMARVVGNTQPKLYYQIPLDAEFNNAIGSVLGIGVDFYLDGK